MHTDNLRKLALETNDGVLRGPALAAADEIDLLRAEINRMTNDRVSLIQSAKDVGASFHKALARAEKAEAERDEARLQVAFNLTTVLAGATETPRAWLDVMGERVRQITAEGWTPEQDDTHVEGEIAGAASAYAMSAAAAIQLRRDAPLRDIPPFFMFEPRHWKPTNARRDLVKSGALILAEIERLDRATDKEGQPQ